MVRFNIYASYGALIGAVVFPLAMFTLTPETYNESLLYADLVLFLTICGGIFGGAVDDWREERENEHRVWAEKQNQEIRQWMNELRKKVVIEEKVMHLFNAICKMNKELFSTGFMTRAVIIDEDYGIGVVFLPFKNNDEKAFAKYALKKLVLSKKIKGYVFISDTHVTQIDQITNETEVKSGLLNILFTPKSSVCKICFYDKEMHFTDEIDMSGDSGGSDWNVWNMQEHDEEMERKYKEFKDKNPEMYK